MGGGPEQGPLKPRAPLVHVWGQLILSLAFEYTSQGTIQGLLLPEGQIKGRRAQKTYPFMGKRYYLEPRKVKQLANQTCKMNWLQAGCWSQNLASSIPSHPRLMKV